MRISLVCKESIVIVDPVIVVAVYMLLSIVASLWTAYSEKGSACDPRGAMVQGALRSLPVTLAIIFAVLPQVSSRIFSVFACERFATGDAAEPYRSFVHTDYRIECTMDNPTYRQAVALAAALIVVYPCGMPFFFAVLLHHSRQSLRNRQHTAITAATTFLHREYSIFAMPHFPY